MKKIKVLLGKIGKKTMAVLVINVFLAAIIRCMFADSSMASLASFYLTFSLVVVLMAALPAIDNLASLKKVDKLNG